VSSSSSSASESSTRDEDGLRLNIAGMVPPPEPLTTLPANGRRCDHREHHR
jgi:hypothetical protein